MSHTRTHQVTLLVAAVLTLTFFVGGTLGPAAHAARLQKHEIKQDGVTRRYLLYTPIANQRFQGPRPLVLVLHGGGGTDRGMIWLTKRRWNRLADQHGFFVAYPNADRRIWDFGEGRISAQRARSVNDLAFLERLIAKVSVIRPVDPRRIFASGISRGGQASYFLGCKLNGRIRAVAPVAMPLPRYFIDDCRSGPPLGVAIINGTQDPLVPYDGGWITVRGKRRDRVISTDETVGLFLSRNGCTAKDHTTTQIDQSDDKTSTTRTDWLRCRGAPVSLYRVQNGGHTWPSGRQYLPAFIIGETSQDFDAAEEAWRFFSQF